MRLNQEVQSCKKDPLILFCCCSSDVKEEEKKWYSHFIPKCCKTSNCCTCKVPEPMKKFWDKYKDSEWKDLWMKIKKMDFKRKDWWLVILSMLVVLLPKAVKFFVLDMFFPGYDVFTDCQAADEHLK